MKEFRKTDDLSNSLPQAEVITNKKRHGDSKMMRNYECYSVRNGMTRTH